MVLIEAPSATNVIEPTDPPKSKTAPLRVVTPQVSQQALARSFDRVNELLDDAEDTPPSAPVAEESLPAVAPIEPARSSADWIAPTWRLYRRWTIWGLSALTGVIAVGGLTLHFMSPAPPHSVVAQPAINEHSPDDTSPTTDQEQTAGVEEIQTERAAEEPLDNSAKPADTAIAADSSAASTATTPPSTEVTSFGPSKPEKDGSGTQQDGTQPDESATSDEGSPIQSDDQKVDTQVAAADPTAEKKPQAFAPADQRTRGRNLFLELANISPDEFQQQTAPAPSADAATSGDVGVGRNGVDSIFTVDPEYTAHINKPRTPVVHPHLAAKLKDKVSSLQIEQSSLRDFLLFFTSLSDLPITIRPEAWQQQQLTLNHPIRLQGKDIQLRNVLSTAVEPLNLVPQAHEGHLRLVSRQLPDEPTRSAVYRVAELLEGDDPSDAASQQRLIDECQRLTGLSNWSSRRGPCSIKVSDEGWEVCATEPVHFELTLVLDQLRTGRGLKPTSPYPERWFSDQTRGKRAEPLLQSNISMHIVSPSPLYEVLDTLSRQAQCDLLVDWEALAADGLPHDTLVTLNVEERTVADAFVKLLVPLQLVYRVIDDRCLQVTTRRAELDVFDVEHYSVAKLIESGVPPEGVTQRIYEVVGINRFHAGGGAGHVYVDAASRTAVVRLPQSHQWVVERFLRETQP